MRSLAFIASMFANVLLVTGLLWMTFQPAPQYANVSTCGEVSMMSIPHENCPPDTDNPSDVCHIFFSEGVWVHEDVIIQYKANNPSDQVLEDGSIFEWVCIDREEGITVYERNGKF
jgi:hypothetical protein